MSGSNGCFLTCIQFSQEAGKVVWYSHLYKDFPVCCDSHKGFSLFNEAVVFLESLCFFYVFLESLCFFYDTVVVGNLIFHSSALATPSLYNWKFSINVLLEPGLKDFEHYLASMWNEWNCIVSWKFFGIALICVWNEDWPFAVLWPLLSFPNLLAYWVEHFNSIVF